LPSTGKSHAKTSPALCPTLSIFKHFVLGLLQNTGLGLLQQSFLYGTIYYLTIRLHTLTEQTNRLLVAFRFPIKSILNTWETVSSYWRAQTSNTRAWMFWCIKWNALSGELTVYVAQVATGWYSDGISTVNRTTNEGIKFDHSHSLRSTELRMKALKFDHAHAKICLFLFNKCRG
jgi:hypothetical protein